MVEPITLGVIAAALIGKAVERAEDKTIDEAASAVQKLVGVVRRHSRETSGLDIRTALARVEVAPDSSKRLRALAEAIDHLVSVDGVFRSDLEGAVADAQTAGLDVSSVVQTARGDQNVQVGGLRDSNISVHYSASVPAKPHHGRTSY